MDFNVTRAGNFTFKGNIVQNKVLDKCISHLSPTQLKEYQELVAIAEQVNDHKVLEAYERTVMIQKKHNISYKRFVGIRDAVYLKKYGEELVEESSNKGSKKILWGYTDAILKPLRSIYKNLTDANI